MGRAVDQIPVVDVLSVVEIRVEEGWLFICISVLDFVYQQWQGKQAFLMVGRFEQA